jgi:sec-independent protein translocase protein TatC
MTDAEHDQPLPLIAHLTELRDRLLRAILAVLVVFVVLFPFANDIYAFVSEPLRALLPDGASMIATEVASPFLTPFKLTLFTAIFLAMPYVLYQAWAFVAPGMYQREKRFAMPVLASSIVLFYLGAAFAYFVVFPLIFAFFTSVGPEVIAIMTDINRYLDFVLKLFFAFGIAFEIPIAALIADLGRHHHPGRPGAQAPLHHRRLLRLRHAAHAPGRDFPVPPRPADVAPV